MPSKLGTETLARKGQTNRARTLEPQFEDFQTLLDASTASPPRPPNFPRVNVNHGHPTREGAAYRGPAGEPGAPLTLHGARSSLCYVHDPVLQSHYAAISVVLQRSAPFIDALPHPFHNVVHDVHPNIGKDVAH